MALSCVAENPGDARAYINRGLARGAKGDVDGAIADSSKAIELNPTNAEAHVNRGVAKLAKGEAGGAIADFTRAIELKPNDPIGHYYLGICYANGEGVRKNPSEAAKMFRNAAEQNVPQAQLRLGLCYYNGEGVAKDPAEAYAWFSMAAKVNPDAVRNRDRLKKDLTPQQFKQAERRAKELQSQIEARPKL